MESGKKQGYSIDSLFSVLLFFTLALCALSIIIMGARVYRNIVENMENNFTSRTALSYLSNKVKQHDVSGAISIEQRHGMNVLVMKEEINGVVYETLIYHKEGNLMELFAEEKMDLPLENGTVILEVEQVRFSMEKNSLLKTELTLSNGETVPLLLAIRSGEKK